MSVSGWRGIVTRGPLVIDLSRRSQRLVHEAWEGLIMGVASTALNQPVSLRRMTAGLWRLIAAAVLVVALTVVAFAIGRATVHTGTASSGTSSLATSSSGTASLRGLPAQRTTTSQSFDGCRTGMPC